MRASSNPPTSLRSPQKILGLLLGLAILAYVLSRMDFRATREGIAQADIGWVLLAFVIFFCSLPLRAVRWQLLLRRVSRHVGILALSSIIFRAWALNCALPGRTGDLYAAFAVREEHQLRGSRTAGTIFTSRVLDLIVLALLVLILFFGGFGELLPEGSGLLGRVAVASILLSVTAVVLIGTTRGLFRRLLPVAVLERYERFLHGFLGSATWWKAMPALLLLTTVLWLIEAVRLGLVMLALGLVPPVTWIIFLALGAAMLTVLPLTPGGLGTVELFYQQLFVLAGIPEEMIGAVVLLDRAINYWFILVAGGALFLFERGRTRERSEQVG